MQSWKFLSVATISIMVVGCGGGGGNSSSTPPAPSATTYNFVAPTLNSQRTYAITIVDNSNNTIQQTDVRTITTVNTDGSFIFTREDPTHNSITVNGQLYSIPNSTTNVNNSDQVTSTTTASSPPGGPSLTCTINPHGAGPTYPFAVGDNWSSSWNEVCGNNTPINFTQTGSVVDTESITVLAGTFTTFKLQSTIVWTDANGTTHTETITIWKDVNGSHTTVKSVLNSTLSGTIPTHGYPVTETIVLENQT